ncbi:DUF2189 domain-containing protein [Stappia taiwanensis]|uniref:DUF2189 domain-containing protein n=1 Tax=Stappia taiwanensis TaxID=992267 RepID=A0A838Y127_9HYPH|nr:DUF2189 domain-containing protein [Stappia taiwanensis]MBA4612753.1 DUF2189 domain-containing protein [Stappia taiwanensis]GGE90339.1 membrane protein [Stappia taiwanensis]
MAVSDSNTPRDPGGGQTPASSSPSPAPSRRPDPTRVNRITFNEIVDALGLGMRDFRRAPVYGLFFGGVYALGGIIVLLSASALNMSYLSYPLAVGFGLIGPFVAVGLYEVSRRLETGQRLDWSGVLGVIWEQRRRELAWMAFVVLFVQIMWMYQVRLLLALFLGFQSFASFPAFLEVVVTTPEGLMFLLVGNVIGAALSVVLFSLTVVSFPMLLDREVDFITAMITSVRSVVTSPVPMIGWALIITVTLLISMLPFFVGLVVTLPILGHATWHLYRRLVPADTAEAGPRSGRAAHSDAAPSGAD